MYNSSLSWELAFRFIHETMRIRIRTQGPLTINKVCSLYANSHRTASLPLRHLEDSGCQMLQVAPTHWGHLNLLYEIKWY